MFLKITKISKRKSENKQSRRKHWGTLGINLGYFVMVISFKFCSNKTPKQKYSRSLAKAISDPKQN
jgi:c-di-GMP-related signal transduction protein